MIKAVRKSRCWACGSLDVIKWGERQGKQRFKCKNCDILFTSENRGVKRSNELIWFKKWVIHRCTIKDICSESGYCEKTLRNKFYSYLDDFPRWIIPTNRVVHLVLDGTYWSNKICLFIYRENQLKETLFYRTTTGEYVDEITEDLINIMTTGVIIESITCDGHRSTLKAIKETNKYIKKQNKKESTDIEQIVVQRCMVHIQRSCLTYLKQDHRSVEGRRLRAIAMTLCRIDTNDKKELFVDAFKYWYQQNREYITEWSYSPDGSRKWRTHKALYSAYTSIKNALPNMFHYLQNSKTPNTTNCLEGYFSHLKTDIAFHRGLSNSHFKNFVRWYVYLKNQK